MKIRSGFVSNSSSSSFIVVGTDDEKICEAIWKAHKKQKIVTDEDCPEGRYYGSYTQDGLACFVKYDYERSNGRFGGLWVVGVPVTESEEITIPVDKAMNRIALGVDVFIKRLSKYGIKINRSKVKLIASESSNE